MLHQWTAKKFASVTLVAVALLAWSGAASAFRKSETAPPMTMHASAPTTAAPSTTEAKPVPTTTPTTTPTTIPEPTTKPVSTTKPEHDTSSTTRPVKVAHAPKPSGDNGNDPVGEAGVHAASNPTPTPTSCSRDHCEQQFHPSDEPDTSGTRGAAHRVRAGHGARACGSLGARGGARRPAACRGHHSGSIWRQPGGGRVGSDPRRGSRDRRGAARRRAASATEGLVVLLVLLVLLFLALHGRVDGGDPKLAAVADRQDRARFR